MTRLVLVLGDQLSERVAALRYADKSTDVVVMAEVRDEASYVRHHPKKIAFLFAAMRKFAARLEAAGWTVRYTRYDDPENAGSIPGELLRRAEETGAATVLATRPGEWRLIELLDEVPLDLTQLEDDRFVASHDDFALGGGAQRASDGVVLPGDAAQDRALDGGRCPGGGEMELRPRQSKTCAG